MEETDKEYRLLMQEALNEAKKAYRIGEVPVGAVFALRGKIIARAHNTVETIHNAGAHAEILVLGEAGRYINDWRLEEGVLCVTLEPCLMCTGALRLARVSKVVYGAPEPRLGAFGSKYNYGQDPDLGPVPKVVSGVCAEECAKLVQEFFREIRAS